MRIHGVLNCVKPGKLFQFVASLTATIGFISDGMQYGWSAPIIPLLQSERSHIKITHDDETWLEAMYLIAGLAGLPLAAYFPDKIGRQKSILLSACFGLVAWTIIALANRVEYLYVGRFLAGLSSDLIYVGVPMYISEIADQQIRGFLTGLVYVKMLIGFVFIYALAPFVPFYVPSVVGIGLLLFQLLTFSFMPESPYFHMARGKEQEAKLALSRLKPKDSCDAEIIEIAKAFQKLKEDETRFQDVILKKSSMKVILIVGTVTACQHFCGLSVVLMNLHAILMEAGSVYFDSNTAAIIFAVLMLLAVVITSFMVDKFGRKKFLIASTVLSGLCLFLLGAYLHVKSLGLNLDFVSFLPIVYVMVYAVVFNMGLGVVPKILASELFSNKIKAVGMTFGDAVYGISGSLSVIFYKYLSNYYGMYVPFYTFGVICFFATFFTVFVIPETKGKSLEEIQAIFEK